MAFAAITFLAETEVIPLRVTWPSQAGASNLLVIWSPTDKRLNAVAIEGGSFSAPFVLAPENWGHGNLLPTNISIFTPSKTMSETLLSAGTITGEQRQLLQRQSHLTAMKAALSTFFKEVSRVAKEGGDLGMEELENIWLSAKSEVEADEAKMEIRHQKEDLAEFMQQCAAQFSVVQQQEAADTATSQSVLARLEQRLDQLSQEMASMRACPPMPPAQPPLGYMGPPPSVQPSAYPSGSPMGLPPTITLDPSTWVSYFFATRNVESLQMELSRLLHCPYEFHRYTLGERGCVDGFWANFRDAFRTPESTTDERFAVLQQEAIRVLRINLARKGIVLEEKRQRIIDTVGLNTFSALLQVENMFDARFISMGRNSQRFHNQKNGGAVRPGNSPPRGGKIPRLQ